MPIIHYRPRGEPYGKRASDKTLGLEPFIIQNLRNLLPDSPNRFLAMGPKTLQQRNPQTRLPIFLVDVPFHAEACTNSKALDSHPVAKLYPAICTDAEAIGACPFAKSALPI